MKNLETPGKTSRVGRYAFYSCTELQVAKLMEAGEVRGVRKFSRLKQSQSSENSPRLYLTVLCNRSEAF